jgi:hypothetical protein
VSERLQIWNEGGQAHTLSHFRDQRGLGTGIKPINAIEERGTNIGFLRISLFGQSHDPMSESRASGDNAIYLVLQGSVKFSTFAHLNAKGLFRAGI